MTIQSLPNPTDKSMQTDPTKAKTNEDGFTQAWDTVGAGAKPPTPERA
ncbi:MAG: hypothetical protein ACPLZC_02795 [Candidatus Bathyarchaeales archaeon]